MALQELDLFEGVYDKEKVAIERLRYFEPPEGYFLAFSGGKDSIVIYKLAEMSEVKFFAFYNHTTIEPPEVISFIRKNYPKVKIFHPKEHLLNAMLKYGFPTRQRRWCCSAYKEKSIEIMEMCETPTIILGVRREESTKRAGRKIYETCFKDKRRKFVNPIVDWTEDEVWEFIRKHKLEYCSLYDIGYKRVGCIMCPLASQESRIRDAERYPRYKKLFIKYFRLFYERCKNPQIKERYKNGEELFNWWLYNIDMVDFDQTILFE